MAFRGRLDKDAETVSISGEDVDLETLTKALDWLCMVRWWMREKDIANKGGRRWEFQQGVVPVARLMRGKVGICDVELTQITPRKACKCTSCCKAIEAKTLCWRQKPGVYRGHSRARFCTHCVERGHAHRAPKLKLIIGGVE